MRNFFRYFNSSPEMIRLAVIRGVTVDAQQNMGAAWYVPTFVVPVLLVTQFMVFARLLRAKSDVP